MKRCAKSDDIIRRRLPFQVKLPRDKRKQDDRKITESSLYEALRALRAEIAAEEKVPAYVVFSNATLQDMCARRPITPGELLEVSGVGRAKADKYGDAFLACIKKHVLKAAGHEPASLQVCAAAQRISAQDQGLLVSRGPMPRTTGCAPKRRNIFASRKLQRGTSARSAPCLHA